MIKITLFYDLYIYLKINRLNIKDVIFYGSFNDFFTHIPITKTFYQNDKLYVQTNHFGLLVKQSYLLEHYRLFIYFNKSLLKFLDVFNQYLIRIYYQIELLKYFNLTNIQKLCLLPIINYNNFDIYISRYMTQTYLKLAIKNLFQIKTRM